MINNYHSPSFKSTTRIYFYTNDGKRILSDSNVRKCERYVVRQLNGAKNLKEKNIDLINTFKFDTNKNVGDKNYFYHPVVRSFYNKLKGQAQGFVNLFSGNDVNKIDSLGKEIGKSKKMSKEIIGSTKSFETSYAIDRYYTNASKLVDSNGIYKDENRQAFGVIFEPKYKKDGTLKEFKYVRSGYFDENKVR